MKKLFVTLILLLGVQWSYANELEQDPSSEGDLHSESHSDSRSEEYSIFMIQDMDGKPLKGAQVLLGMKVNDPFINNFYTSDYDGKVQLQQSWSAEPVTVSYPGFVRTTFYGITPGEHKFYLHRSTYQKIELTGETTGFVGLNTKDDNLDEGLVFEPLALDDLISFNLDRIFNSTTDPLDVEIGYGLSSSHKSWIFSNITFPKQEKKYFLDVTLNKPMYRTAFNSPGKKKILALQMQLPLSKLMNGDNKLDTIACLNNINFMGGSIREVHIPTSNNKASPVKMDLPVNEINFTDTITVKNNYSIPEQNSLVTIAALEEKGLFYPTDMKRMELGQSQKLSLKTANFGEKYLIAVMKRNIDFNLTPTPRDAVSVNFFPIHNNSGNIQSGILDLIPQPQGTLNHWQISAPKEQDDVEVLGTYAILSSVPGYATPSENVEKAWEFYSPHWITELKLPEWPTDSLLQALGEQKLVKSFEVSYLGAHKQQPSQNLNPLGPKIFHNTTHITYNRKYFR